MTTKLLLLSLMTLTLLACTSAQQEKDTSVSNDKSSMPISNHQDSPNSHEDETKAPTVYVTAINDDSGMSDAVAIIGVLNVKNGCLMINDELIVITSAIVHWTQQPFVLTNHLGKTFKLGDTVMLGGSFTRAKNLFKADKINWQNPPLLSCLTDKFWLMGSINETDDFNE